MSQIGYEMMKERKHPLQNVCLNNGVERFVPNSVVTSLFKKSGLTLEQIFEQHKDQPKDCEQFAMLLGGSLQGFRELCENPKTGCQVATFHFAKMKKRIVVNQVESK